MAEGNEGQNPAPDRPSVDIVPQFIPAQTGEKPKRMLTVTMPGAIALAVVGAFIGALFVVLLRPLQGVDQVSLSIISLLLGALVAKFTTIVDYFFGSSEGSKGKDDTVANVVASQAKQLEEKGNGHA